VPRVLDFGVAKAAGRMQTTREGQLKGKLAYMAAEQLRGGAVTRTTDVYAVGVVMWETLVLQRLFEADNEGHLLAKVLEGRVSPPSALRADVPPELDAIVLRAVSSDATQRFTTAREMALAIERVVGLATASEVGEWVMTLAGATLARRAERLADLDGAAQKSGAPTERPPVQRRGTTTSALSEETLASAPGRGSVPAPPERTSATVAPPRPSLSPPLEKTPASTMLGASAVATQGAPASGAAHVYVPSAPSSAVTPPSSHGAAGAAGAISTTTGVKRTRRHILVIDDSEVMLSRIRRALELEGYDVTATARAVGNARHIASSDLIIIDFHMPGIDGGTVIASLRAAATTKGHPCLFYLYTSDKAVARDYRKLGFDGCFTDKGNEESLARQVRAVFRMLQMRQLPRKA
jgi:CheY-like chemotaxis protein